MGFEEENAAKIKLYLDNNESAKTKEEYTVIFGYSNSKKYPVYKIPLDLITYNFENARVEAEVQNYSHTTGNLDLNNEDDRQRYESLFEKEQEEDINDLFQKIFNSGQLEPGIMTYSGILIDGNRRLMVLRMMERAYDPVRMNKIEKGIMKVVRLEEDIDKDQLLALQAFTQMSDYRKPKAYSPINEILLIKKLHSRGFSHESLTDLFQKKMTRSEISQKLDTLVLVDKFLQSTGNTGNYKLINKNTISLDVFVEFNKSRARLDNSDLDEDKIPRAKDLCTKVAFKAFANNLDPQMKKYVLDGRTLVRKIDKPFKNESNWEKLEKILEYGDTKEEKIKVYKDLRSEILTADAIGIEENIVKTAERAELNIDKVLNYIRGPDFEEDDPELLKVLLKYILQSGKKLGKAKEIIQKALENINN